jgi:hypothetical protein
MTDAVGKRIRVLNGDVCLRNFGLTDADYNGLTAEVSYIIHLAADIRLNEPLENLRRINVEGVRNVRDFAFDVHRRRGLARLPMFPPPTLRADEREAYPRRIDGPVRIFKLL